MVAVTPPLESTDAFPFNGVAAEQSDWQKMAKSFCPTGVVNDGSFTNPLLVGQHGGGDLTVDINAGRIWIEGAYAEFGTLTNLSLGTPPNATLSRTDLVVARATWGTPKVVLDWVTGTPDVVPTTPALTQVLGQTWEVALAQVTMGAGATVIGAANITDRRPLNTTALSPTRLPQQTAVAAVTVPLNQYASYQPAVPFWVLPLATAGSDVAVTSLNAGASNLPALGAWIILEAVNTNANTITLTNGSNLVLTGNYAMIAGDHVLLYTNGSVWYEVARNRPLSGPVAANTFWLGPTSGANAASTQRLALSADMPVGPGNPTLMALASPGIDNGRLAFNAIRAPNLCINPGYEVWQRGNGAFTASGAATCDRHQITLESTDTLSVTKDTTHQDIGSANCAQAVFTLVGGTGSTRHTQPIKTADLQTVMLQQTLSYQVRIKIQGGGNTICRAGISWNGGSSNTSWSAYNTNTTDYQTLFVTATTAGNLDTLEVGVWFAASATVWIDNEVLVVGTVAPNFSGRLYQEDLYQCQRYYEIAGQDNAADLIISGGVAAAGGETVYATIPWKVEKATGTVLGPSATIASIKQGTWDVLNCAQPAADAVSRYGVRLKIISTAATEFRSHNGNAGAQLIAICTP